MTTVKDGQWGWAIIAMGASAIYELWDAFEKHKPIPNWAGLALFGLILVIVSAALIAAFGASFSIALLTTVAGGWKAWATHYKVFVISAALTAGTAFLYTLIHFRFSP